MDRRARWVIDLLRRAALAAWALVKLWPVAAAVGALMAVALLRSVVGPDYEAVPTPAPESRRSARTPEVVVPCVSVVAKAPEGRERRRLEREYGVKIAEPGAAGGPGKPDPAAPAGTTSRAGIASQAPTLRAGDTENRRHGELDLGERVLRPLPRGGWALGTLDEGGRWQLRFRDRRFAWTGDAGFGVGAADTGGGLEPRFSLWAAPLEWKPARRLPPLVLSGRVSWGPTSHLRAEVWLDPRLFGRD